jgi:hypothetical protein
MSGPLAGLRVVEMAGIGPGSFCAMLFADLGAEVIRIRRPGGTMFDTEPGFDVTARGCRFLELDLREKGTVEIVLQLIEKAEVLTEGYRPGVMERYRAATIPRARGKCLPPSAGSCEFLSDNRDFFWNVASISRAAFLLRSRACSIWPAPPKAPDIATR